MDTQNMLETGLTFQWHVPHRVLYMTVHVPISDQDSTCADETLLQYLNQATESVHLLVDVTELGKTSSMMLPMSGQIIRHGYIGWIITIGVQQNSIINFGISALSPTTKIQHRSRQTVNEALAFLQHSDTSLPDLSPYMVC